VDWELRWPMKSDVPYPKTYSVVSELPVLNNTALSQTTAGWGTSDPNKAEHRQYYNLPQTVTKRAAKLAQQITAGSASDYEKALRIQTYLKDNFPYTNEPNTSLRTSPDFVDSFLFEVKEGYCDYFSTAMAVLGRTVGLPVRWVKGYAPGVLPINEDEMRNQGFIPDEAMQNPNGEGTYTVRNADAHSWVEIYFDGFGWIPFEATPGFEFPYPVEEEQAITLPDIDLSDITRTAVAETSTPFFSPRAVMWYSVILLAVLLAYGWFRRQQLADSYARIRYRATNANERIIVETNRLVRFARRKGLQREEWETVREASERWAKERTYLRADLKIVADCFEQAKYGTTVYEQGEVDRFLALVRSIRDRM
jgi:transglutaminase-like putative cysteine protease